MTDKSGGDVYQGNAGLQGNLSTQGLNSVAAGGAGVLESLGGAAASMGAASQAVTQNQNQSNAASTGNGGNDNIHADTNINV